MGGLTLDPTAVNQDRQRIVHHSFKINQIVLFSDSDYRYYRKIYKQPELCLRRQLLQNSLLILDLGQWITYGPSQSP